MATERNGNGTAKQVVITVPGYLQEVQVRRGGMHGPWAVVQVAGVTSVNVDGEDKVVEDGFNGGLVFYAHTAKIVRRLASFWANYIHDLDPERKPYRVSISITIVEDE